MTSFDYPFIYMYTVGKCRLSVNGMQCTVLIYELSYYILYDVNNNTPSQYTNIWIKQNIFMTL